MDERLTTALSRRTLLGARRMTSHVMVANGSASILDYGLGVTNQYARTGLDFGAIRSIFITHHHPDHNVELGPLLVIGWVHGLQPSVIAGATDDEWRNSAAKNFRGDIIVGHDLMVV